MREYVWWGQSLTRVRVRGAGLETETHGFEWRQNCVALVVQISPSGRSPGSLGRYVCRGVSGHGSIGWYPKTPAHEAPGTHIKSLALGPCCCRRVVATRAHILSISGDDRSRTVVWCGSMRMRLYGAVNKSITNTITIWQLLPNQSKT